MCVVVVVFMVNSLAHWKIFRPLIRTSFQILHFLKCHIQLKNLKRNLHVSLSLSLEGTSVIILLTLIATAYNFIFFQTLFERLQEIRLSVAAERMDVSHLSQAQRVHGGERVYPENALRWTETEVPHCWGWAHLLLATVPPPCPPYIFKA